MQFIILLKYSNFFNIIILILGLIFWKKIPLTRKIIGSKLFLKITLIIAIVIFCFYFLQMVRYLFIQTYFDTIEPSVINVSYLGMLGYPLYPDPANGALYGLPYGPGVFLTNGLAVWLSPTLWASKIPGMIAALGALCAGWFLFRRLGNTRTSAFLALATMVMFLVGFGHYAYWSRPEPFLLLLAILGLWVMTLEEDFLAASVLGVLTGLAITFKIHGVLYFLAPALVILYRTPSRSRRIWCGVLGVGPAILVALLPFTLSHISLSGYLAQLAIVGRHRLDLLEFDRNIVYLATLLLPAVLFVRGRGLILPRWQQLFCLAGFISALILVVISSKQGAGFHHLIPLIPTALVAMHFLVKATPRPPLAPSALWASLFLIGLMAYWPGYFVTPAGRPILIAGDEVEYDQKAAEIKGFLARFPMAEMAITDRKHHLETMLSPLAVFSSGHRYHDPGAFLDLFLAGSRDPHLIPLFTTCTVPAWIMPAGEMFNFLTYDDEAPIYPPIIKETFLKTHRKVEQGQYYSLWACEAGTG